MGKPFIGKAFRMSEETSNKMSRPSTKEQRLAAKLRENLRRRKAQGREMKAESGESGVSKDGDQS
jgi:hypothetical protein